MARNVIAGRLVFCQPDFFEFGGRQPGISWYDIQSCNLFVNQEMLPWPVCDGTFVADSGIGSGAVYFSEIQGSPGFYSARFFPDRPGYWRLVIKHHVFGESAMEFDATSPSPQASGLIASFGI